MRARELLALHDQTLQELHGLDDHRPLLVDLLAEGHTPARVLRAARERAPGAELVARFRGGFAAALELLLAGRLDVAFGRSEGLGRPFPAELLARRLVRLEPLALLLPQEHPLAALEALHASIDELAAREHWHERPPGAWLPEADTSALGLASAPPG